MIALKSFEEVKNFVNDEKSSWPEVQRLRRIFENAHHRMFDELPIFSKEQTITGAISIVKKILFKLAENGVDFNQVEPGHGIGHLIRDYLHSLRLAKDLMVDPRQLYIGIVGGVFHDMLGCVLVPRYQESKRVVRHAEAGAIHYYVLAEELGLSEAEKVLGFYSMAAHTHYLKAQAVNCSDGLTREIRAYHDLVCFPASQEAYLDASSKDFGCAPIMAIWLTRWADRLDVNGPAFVGRHYLTLSEEHEDFAKDSQSFYSVKFADHMRPLLRSNEEIKATGGNRTMREHMNMFANSQNNQSPYGKYDYGVMVDMRDSYKEMLFRIIASFDESAEFTEDEKSKLLDSWTHWLGSNIEPTQLGKKTAQNLKNMFLALDDEIKNPWCRAFAATLREYKLWVGQTLEALKYFPEDYLNLPVIGDIRKVVAME